MKIKYKSEIEAMRDFYEELGFREKEIDYSCNTDGRIKGTLVEIKLNNSVGVPIKQLKRYLKSYNSVALDLPRYSLFININQREFAFIDNNNWKIDDEGKWKHPQDLLKFLNKDEYIKGWIDEYSIVSYNDKFYTNHISAKKEDFIEEIKNPKELYIKPYQWNETGDMERSILDCLGGKELKKRLGAFFTPDKYVKISTKYLRNTIARVLEESGPGYDYIILDRCAGTGNLEKFLTNEELSHCILNTYVYAEWTTLQGLYGGRARCIIPHTDPRPHKDPDGLLSDGDALTQKFDKIITDIIDEERRKVKGKLIIIGLENPPYSEPQAEATRGGKTHKQSSWVKDQMKNSQEVKGAVVNDLANQFIWSMTRKYADEYIVFSPIKYWKSQHLFDGKFNEGYLCNRKKFHATEAAISLISWTIDEEKNNCLEMKSDLDLGDREIKKIKLGISSSTPKSEKINTYASLYHISGTPDFKHACLVNAPANIHAKEYNLNNANIFQALPLWTANCYKSKDYTEKEVIMKSGDGGIAYQKDKEFLNDCFVYSCLTNANKCISNGQVKNELCLGQDTEADKLLDSNGRNSKLLQQWRKILEKAKVTKEYNPKYNYGLHQICKDINIKVEIKGEKTKRGEPIMEYKYSDLNEVIKELKELLKEFYDKQLTPKLFKYELLK